MGLGHLPALLAGISPGFLLLTIFYDATILALAVGTLFLAPRREQFEASRRHDRVLSVRVENLIRVDLLFRGQAAVRVQVRDEPPSEFDVRERSWDLVLRPNRLTEVSYHVKPHHRGDYVFRELFLKVRAPLGLVYRIYRLPVGSPVSVYPNILALRKYDLLRHRGHLREMGIRRASLKNVGSEFESLREYAVGDEIRRVDWKASARKSKLIVRQYESERSQSVLLVLDLGRLMMAEVGGVRKYDHVVDAALMLANAAATAQDRIGLLVYHDQVVRFVPPRRGRGQLGVILDALHGLDPEPVESDASRAFNYLAKRWRKRSLVVAFTDLIEPEASAAALSALGALRRRHLCVAATVADPKLEALTTRRVTDSTTLYQRAVALQVEDDRKRAIRTLELSGVRVVDAEPERLAQSLINLYTEIKARSEL